MRRLAGSLIFFIAVLLTIYSASWMLYNYKSEAQISKKTTKTVFGESVSVSTVTVLTSIPTNMPISTTKPTLTNTPTLIPKAKMKEDEAVKNTNRDVKNYLLDMVNEFRRSKGLSAAISNSETCSFAKIRAGEISKNFNHDGFTQRINSQTLPYPSYKVITENIAMNSNYKEVVNNWINSSLHAKNMLDDTPYVCIWQDGDYYAYEGWNP